MRLFLLIAAWCAGCGAAQTRSSPAAPAAEVVSFASGALTLRGVVYKPAGAGPFPALLYNHGSAPGMLNSQAFEQLGPLFARHGWLFFAPYRRGQGLSESAGPYLGDQIQAAAQKAGAAGGSAVMVRLLETDHLDDQLAALAWLRGSGLAAPGRIATAGNSFGGIESVLGAEREDYCAAVDAAGGSQSWQASPELQTLMTRAVRNARAPIFFFQAENDFDLTPTRTLAAEMKSAGRQAEMKIYPAFGGSEQAGHSFAWRGSAVWFGDALRFLNQHCAPGATGLPARL